jgi:arginine decarboxylase
LETEDLLIEQLKRYGKSNRYPFHMPGHKRQIHGVTEEFPNPYSIDITEIEGFDNLHHSEGILKRSMEFAAQAYGADKTFYLINGSSSGILSAIHGVTSYNSKIIIGRNCHKSAYHGIILNNLNPVYIYPQIIEKMWINGGYFINSVENALEENPDVKAVLLVSPTYEGIVSDIKKIAEIVHKKQIPLIIDEAHGAHFSFGRSLFPASALDCGADIVIQSLHKTLPSFTQTAVIHVKSKYVDVERLEWYLQVYQSSSPSYILMAGIEKCIFEMYKWGEQYFTAFGIKLKSLRKRLGKMKHLRILDASVAEGCGVYDLDLSKIVVSCRGLSITGVELAEILREKYDLEMEMWGADYVVAITTISDTNQGLERLEKAFLEIDESLYGIFEERNREVCRNIDKNINERMNAKIFRESDKNILKNIGTEEKRWLKGPEIVMTLKTAMERKFETLSIEKCAGHVSREFVYLYPPGIPIVVPGERVSEEMAKEIYKYKKMGFSVQGMADKRAEYLQVIV